MKTKLLLFVVAINIISCQSILAQASRLIAQVGLDFGTTSYTPYDSIAYYYTGSYGGDLNHTLKFATDTDRSYSGFSYTLNGVTNQTFDASSNIATTTYLMYLSGSFVNVSLQTNTYDASHNLLIKLVQGWNSGTSTWHDSLKYTYTYDGSGNQIAIYLYQWITTSSALIPALYDTSITVSSTVKVLIGYVWSSTTLTGTYINSTLDTFYLNGSGYSTSHVSYLWNGTTWVRNLLTNTKYDVKGNPISDTAYQWALMGSTYYWKNFTVANNTYDVNNNLIIFDYISWSGTAWVNYIRYHYYYNTYNQMTSYEDSVWDAGSSSYKVTSSCYKLVYYYQTYTNTGVGTLNNATVDVNIFPNPSNKSINIRINWNELQPFDVTIYNMNGQIMSNYQEDATPTYHRQIPVDYWAAGNYMVVVKTNSGQTTRQFVVRH